MSGIKGMKELQRAFVDFGKALEKNQRNALKLTGNAYKRDVQKGAPHITGTYRRSIHLEPEGSDTILVGTDLEYGPRLEYGYADTDKLGRTYNQAAQPHFRPPLDTKFSEYQQIYLEAMFA
ncbi:MAG: HK97 gp10 family phage protein [Deltaproteobacteria bacterium]|nr:HK97 gp10 family phage protein [Deltaproteobacteria bacterium]